MCVHVTSEQPANENAEFDLRLARCAKTLGKALKYFCFFVFVGLLLIFDPWPPTKGKYPYYLKECVISFFIWQFPFCLYPRDDVSNFFSVLKIVVFGHITNGHP